MAKESERHVDSIIRAMEILDCFIEHPELTNRQISEITKMNKSRIMRFCGTLQAKGYLLYEPEGRKFRLGPRALSLGEAYERSNSLISIARPILRELAQSTGETASISVVENLQRVYLLREEGSRSVRYSITEGNRVPLYAGASSKVLLAFGPEKLRGQLLKKGKLKKLTPTTITDPKKFQRELKTIRQKGYAVSAGERDPEIGSLSAPIYDHTKKFCAAIALAGPIARFFSESQSEYLEALMTAAQELSRQLGYEL